MVITNDELNQLPIAEFPGTIEVIDTIERSIWACDVLRKASLIGFDTETRPSFRKGVQNELSLIQLSLYETCFLFRISKLGEIPQALINIFDSKTIKLIGLSLKDDFDKIRKMTSLNPNNFVDLQNVVKGHNIEEQSLRKIYALLFQQRISKGQRLSNWDAEVLAPAQQMYAAMDAWACLRIYTKLMDNKL